MSAVTWTQQELRARGQAHTDGHWLPSTQRHLRLMGWQKWQDWGWPLPSPFASPEERVSNLKIQEILGESAMQKMGVFSSLHNLGCLFSICKAFLRTHPGISLALSTVQSHFSFLCSLCSMANK